VDYLFGVGVKDLFYLIVRNSVLSDCFILEVEQAPILFYFRKINIKEEYCISNAIK
jgi:hypothetical protein